MTQQAPSESPPGRPTDIAERVARELSGDLRCVGCGYSLRGLSVRAACPECNLGVLATVLSVVDPKADQLQPIAHPRLVAIGLLAWPIAALAAALTTWAIHALDLLSILGLRADPAHWMPGASAALIACSGLAACPLARPHANIRPILSFQVLLAVLLHAPLILTQLALLTPVLNMGQNPYHPVVEHGWQRHALRLVASILMAAIILLLRPSARLLAARSVVVRTGRVDRQSMYALAGALGIAALGDIVALLGTSLTGPLRDVLPPVGDILIALGSLLFTIGLVGIVIDASRLVPIILHPAPGSREAFEGDSQQVNDP